MRSFVAILLLAVLSVWGLLSGPNPMAAQVLKQPEVKKVDPKKEPPKKEEPKKEPAPVEEFDQGKSDRATLEQAGLQAKPEVLLDFFRRHSVDDSDRAKMVALIKQLGDADFDQRQSATDALIKYGVAAIGMLRQSENSPDQEISLRCDRILRTIEKVPTRNLAAASARVLAQLKPEGTAQVLLNYMPLSDDDSVTDEIRATLAAVAVKDGTVNKTLTDTLTSTEVIKRGAAAEALVRGGNDATRETMRAFLAKETNSEIRLRMAMVFVATVKDKKLVPEMIKQMAEVTPDIGWRAEEILCRIAGETAPAVSLGTDVPSRQKARDEWTTWWTKNGEKADLAKLDAVDRLLGLTLVLEYNIQGAGGRVAELRSDGKPAWEIKGVMFPTDAIVLPGNRVIIAEQNSARVAEFDTLTGKTVWTEQVNQPISLQRLTNGNLVVTCRNEIFEWDRSRKRVSTITRNQYDIVAGAKLRNGQFVVVTNQGQVIRMTKDSKVEKTFSLVGRANYNSTLQVLPNNRVLITDQRAVKEYDLDTGKEVGWTCDKVNFPTSAYRLPNGNTIISSSNNNKAIEVDRDNKEVWSYTSTDNLLRPWRVKRR